MRKSTLIITIVVAIAQFGCTTPTDPGLQALENSKDVRKVGGTKRKIEVHGEISVGVGWHSD